MSGTRKKYTNKRAHRSLGQTLIHLFHPQHSNNHRPKILHHTAYFYFLGLVAVFFVGIHLTQFLPTYFNSILGFSSSITASEVILQTNEQRQNAGLGELTLDSELTQAALAKAQDMMTDQYWSHVAPDGTQPWYFISQSGYNYSVAGENLARDFGDTSSMMSAWMASVTHRANILNPKYQEIGIAVVDGELLGYETTLVVQMFGKPTTYVSDGQNSGGPSVPVAVREDVTSVIQEAVSQQQVLAGALVPTGELSLPTLFTPLQLSKAFFLALIMMIIATLLYDGFVVGHQKTVRLVGKNLAHLVFFSAIAYLVVFFKAGLVG